MSDAKESADQWINTLHHPGDLHCDHCGHRGYVAGWHARDGEIERLTAERDGLHAQIKGVGIVPYLDRMKEQTDEIERLRDECGFGKKVDVSHERRIMEQEQEIERLRATIKRVNHFAVGACDMGTAVRLRCIEKECQAEHQRETDDDRPS